MTVLHWFRRDLRLTDNPALHAAVKSADEVIPVYLLSTWQGNHHWTGAKRQQFLCDCLASLAANLEAKGSQLIVRKQPSVEALINLAKEVRAEAIYASQSAEPFGREEERKLALACEQAGIKLHLFGESWLQHPEALRTKSDLPYRVFTPFSKSWFAAEWAKPVPAPAQIHTRKGLASEALPSIAHWGLDEAELEGVELPKAGERAARQRFEAYLAEGLGKYQDLRDPPAEHATSTISADLRHGLLSVRELAWRVLDVEKNAEGTLKKSAFGWNRSLAWRDFYTQILWHWPEVLDHAFQQKYDEIPWLPAEGAGWEAFCAGKTGFPIVDAGIRQLLKTGWMHNRVRMIVAMFLTKDLHIHWRAGEAFFMRHLIDGDMALNNGNWQWSAGTGADAAPYFRIQNPWLQSKRHDPQGEYIKRWVPELKNCRPEYFFEPQERPFAVDYPLPILDHHEQKDVTVAWFKEAGMDKDASREV